MAMVSSNVNLETYDGSRSKKSYNNVRSMLSMSYFHSKTIRNSANFTADFEKSRSKISHFRPQKKLKKFSRNPGRTDYYRTVHNTRFN